MNAANRTIGSDVERWARLLNGRRKKKESGIGEEPFILKVFSYVHECGRMYGKENFIIYFSYASVFRFHKDNAFTLLTTSEEHIRM